MDSLKATQISKTIKQLEELKRELYDRESELLADLSGRLQVGSTMRNIVALRNHQLTIRDAIFLLKTLS